MKMHLLILVSQYSKVWIIVIKIKLDHRLIIFTCAPDMHTFSKLSSLESTYSLCHFG